LDWRENAGHYARVALSSSQWRVFWAIAHWGDRKVAKLDDFASLCEVSVSLVSRAVRVLVDKGLVEQLNGKRGHRYRVTALASRSADTFTDEQCRGIYLAYPKRVGAALSIVEIRRALLALADRADIGDPVEWLLGRTKLWANSPRVQELVAKGEEKYILHPERWYKRGHYDDDVTAWGYNGKPATPSARNQATSEEVLRVRRERRAHQAGNP